MFLHLSVTIVQSKPCLFSSITFSLPMCCRKSWIPFIDHHKDCLFQIWSCKTISDSLLHYTAMFEAWDIQKSFNFEEMIFFEFYAEEPTKTDQNRMWWIGNQTIKINKHTQLLLYTMIRIFIIKWNQYSLHVIMYNTCLYI